jgi:hypothetical protein
MAIYRKQPYDYGAKFGNAAQNILGAILGVKGFAGAQEASAASAALDKAQAAKVAEEAARAQQTYLGKAKIPAQLQGIYNAPNMPGDLFTNAEQGFYPYSDEARAGQLEALLGPTGGGKELSALFPQVQQDVAATKAFATPMGQNIAGTAAVTKALREASQIPGMMNMGTGQFSMYSQGGPEEGTDIVDIGGKPIPIPYRRTRPPSLVPGMTFPGVNSEGSKVGQVSPDEMLEVSRLKQGLTPSDIVAMKQADLDRLSAESLADSMLSTDAVPGKLPYSIAPPPALRTSSPFQLNDLTRIPPELIRQLLLKLYGTGGLLGAPQ